MKTKLNYSAQTILFVYKKVNEEKNKAVKNLTLKFNPAFGWFTFDINDVFKENGEDTLKYNYVGYGGVNFLGNINGKIPTQGLYYKNIDIKTQIENFIIILSQIAEDERDAIRTIHEQHGMPEPQHCILYDMAKQ